MDKKTEKIILEKLKLQKRSALFILKNKALSKRILNETPMLTYDVIKKYNVSIGFVRRLIKDRVISSFSNLNERGSKLYVFEEELVEYVIKNSINYTTNEIYKMIRDTVNIYVQLIHNSLDYQEFDFVNRYLKGQGLENVAKENNLTRSRVSQIVEKALRRMKYTSRIRMQYDEVRKEYNILKAEYNILLDCKNSRLKNNPELRNKFMSQKRYYQFQNIKIVDCDFTVRALNAMKANEIDTIYDLLLVEKNEFMRYRNFGIKSFKEIEDFLKKEGLTFGMLKHLKNKYN